VKPVKILVADDHTLFRAGLVKLLEAFGYDRLLEAGNGAEAVDLAKNERPDLILLDIEMPVLSGIDACRQIKGDNPDIFIIMLTMHDEDEFLFEAIKAGASGYILKNHAARDLRVVIEKAFSGQSLLDPELASRLMVEFSNTGKREKKRADLYHLITEREREVLKLITEGMSNKEIAKILYISDKTVKNHLKNIFRKLHVNDRTKAAVIALKEKLVEV